MQSSNRSSSIMIEDIIGEKAEVDSYQLIQHGDPARAEAEKNLKKSKITVRGVFQSSSNLMALVEEERGKLHVMNIIYLRMIRNKTSVSEFEEFTEQKA